MGPTIAVVDGHEIFRAGLKRLLEKQGMRIVGEAEVVSACTRIVQESNPNIIILDLAEPVAETIEVIRKMITAHPTTKVIALCAKPDRFVTNDCLRAGASAMLVKSSDATELLLAVKVVLRGETYLSPSVTNLVVSEYIRDREGAVLSTFVALTPKQREVLQLLADGKTNKEIGSSLGISTKTVEAHRAQIMVKLNIRTVAGLTKYAIREGLTSVET